ncbi:MAG: class II fructose-bisphosphate aldolase [Anaerolineae bacterium]|nr:class II fructose-bisphosphate aldolase [Anaerolineae bacterium]
MALVSIVEELNRAVKGKYALPLYDTFDMFSTEGMFEAAEEKRAPFMLALYAGHLERTNAEAFAAYIKMRAQQVTVPVSLWLDHGSSFEQCMKAIKYGFTDVMFDGSRLPVEENIATTKAIVRVAHQFGVAVEAELGHVGSGREYREYGSQGKGFTDPDSVVNFVAQTGVDFLAIAIGTAHGLYDGDPVLNMTLLDEIRKRVDIPLVLHGGSGCSDAQFREVIARGISKINVATDLVVTTGKRMVAAAQESDTRYFDLTTTAVESFKERCGHYYDVFGTSGKAV